MLGFLAIGFIVEDVEIASARDKNSGGASQGNAGLEATQRRNLRPGQLVAIVQKKDQGTGTLTIGVLEDILTSKATHSRGIKVRLESGEVGRVQEILTVHTDG